jgi:MYM-type Zinc finger with FCS sequence motif
MNSDLILNNIKTYGSIEQIVHGVKRLCYLIACAWCKKLHYKEEHEITRGIRRNKKFLCSVECRNKDHSTSLKLNCTNCGKIFLITPSQFKRSKSGNAFCSKSCSATYNNRHKTYGTRRSKLEIYIEEQIKKFYPNLNCEYNSTLTVGSELDLYFPTLKLAIQINGILHFQPIYGLERLAKIQKLDQEKRDKCKELNVNLIEINCSEDRNVNKKNKELRWAELKSILDKRLAECTVFETDPK